MIEPTWSAGDVQLWRGDCLDVMRGMEAGSVDAIITDIPYGTTACAWDVVIPFEPMWECVKHVLRPRGVFVTTASQPFTSMLVMSKLEWFRDEVIWEKERPSNIFNMHTMHGKTHENILVFSSDSSTFNPQKYKNNKKRTREKMQRYVGNKLKHHDGKSVTSIRSDWDGTVSMPRSVVYFVRDIGKDNHPTQKPVALYEYLIRTYTDAGDTVLDFAFGSGTTMVAAHKTGRLGWGIELKDSYFDIAVSRIQNAQRQPPLFV